MQVTIDFIVCHMKDPRCVSMFFMLKGRKIERFTNVFIILYCMKKLTKQIINDELF